MKCDGFFIPNTCIDTPIRYFILYNSLADCNNNRLERETVAFCERCSKHLTSEVKENQKMENGFYYTEIAQEQYNIYELLK